MNTNSEKNTPVIMSYDLECVDWQCAKRTNISLERMKANNCPNGAELKKRAICSDCRNRRGFGVMVEPRWTSPIMNPLKQTLEPLGQTLKPWWVIEAPSA